MQDKKKASYKSVFEFIRDDLKMEFQEIMTDFELGLKNAAREVFRDVKLISCWFHFTQALNRRFQKLPSSVRYSFDCKEFIAKFMALPLLPAALIEKAYYEIKQEIYERETNNIFSNLADFYEYFENFWLSKIGAKNFTVFSVFQRTNNNSEQMNALLAKKISTKHPNVWIFLGMIDNFFLLNC